MPPRRHLAKLEIAAIAAAGVLVAHESAWAARTAPPPGFAVETIASGWSEVVGTAFMPDGKTVVWERAGRVWLVTPEGVRLPQPLLDIRDEVGGWRDYGLLGFALHPEFETNGWFYCFYVVDRHHLDFAGTGAYNPTVDTYYAATIGRLTRYTADAATDFTTIVPDSRAVLLGEDASSGVPIVHQSHGLGSIVFGSDGTLLVSTGDAASYNEVDVGGQVGGGYVDDALARGILRAKDNVGAWRSQLMDSMNGKLLRLDAATGDGVPSNPFFDSTSPRAPRSRVFALGLRNPFRMSIVPHSGSHNPADALPGVISIGDVGWSTFEDVQVCDGAGQNFGWPAIEGLSSHPGYQAAAPLNQDAPTGLSSPSHYRFNELIREASQDVTGSLAIDAARFIQAESVNGSGAAVTTTYGGFHGSAYRDYSQNSGAWIDFPVTAATAGAHTLHVRHALGATTNRPLRVRVDGAIAVTSMDFLPTGAWTEWRIVSIPLSLSAGAHTIRLETFGSNGSNIDGAALVAGSGGPPLLASAGVHSVHKRPVLDWPHSGTVARTPTFTNGAATTVAIGAAGGAAGAPFGGYCSIGGPRTGHKGSAALWPAPWNDALYFGDYVLGWVRAASIDASGAVTAVNIFDESQFGLTSIAFNELDDSLWITSWPDIVKRYRYAPSAGLPPTAALAVAPQYGPSPLPVTLSASASTDPEGAALTFEWNFGDGTSPVIGGSVVAHTYSAPAGTPTRFDATVTVRDPAGNTDSATAIVSVNNTPPTATITSLYDGQLYSIIDETVFPLRASISDAESDASALVCSWITTLHHNTHIHSEPPDAACETATTVSPLGCGDETYFFEVSLTVTDGAGLSSTDTVFLYPDCDGSLSCPTDLDHDWLTSAADLAILLGAWGAPGPADFDHSGATDAADLAALLGNWGVPCATP